jgi:hypothetical protein
MLECYSNKSLCLSPSADKVKAPVHHFPENDDERKRRRLRKREKKRKIKRRK